LDLLSALNSGGSVFAAELRPPQAELAAAEGMDAWIDTYHAVRKLTRQGTFVFLTDSAVGSQEEDNLRHLIINLGRDVPRERIVPFLTAKHSLDYCVSYAERAHQHGFPALVVLGGDKSVGTPRSVEHAWQLREMVRRRGNPLRLGGWANPHAEPDRQAEYLSASNFNAEFYLTQVVSHHDADRVARFVAATERKGVTLPALFGVFFYRSANPRTLAALKSFLPVPIDALAREFAAGATAEDVCANTIRTLTAVGARHFYISNLPVGRAQTVLSSILEKVGVTA
jgi:5,10-methylenetetrahydrofolate reductase